MTVDIDFDHIDYDRETKHAHLVIIESGFDEIAVWLPKSQIEIDDKKNIITMPEWLAEEKELI
jgi:hypothetical protein